MTILRDIAYLIAGVFALPLLLIKSYRTGKYRSDWPARFGRVRDEGPLKIDGLRNGPRLMIHCVSVGELLSMRHLIDKLLAADPALRIILTTTTDTGTARARELYGTPQAPLGPGRVYTYRFPLDFSFAVESFFDHTRPNAVALVELETWPNFLQIAASRRIPVIIVNGRLTARAAKRYNLIRPVTMAMFRRVAWFGIQTQTIANRFIALGAPRDRIEIVPTLKYDVADLSDTIPGADKLAAACGIAGDHQLFVGGSTGPGEEDPLLETYLALRTQRPALRLAIAPRKPETVGQVVKAIRQKGLNPVMRTAHPDTAGPRATPLSTHDVLVLDTLGELKKLYSLATCAFVGRSLVQLGGSDMIEVAALAKACCFGPHTSNFAEAVELLTTQQAAVVVHDGGELTRTVAGWLADPAAAAALGAKARRVIAAQRGSTDKYVRKLLSILELATPASPTPAELAATRSDAH